MLVRHTMEPTREKEESRDLEGKMLQKTLEELKRLTKYEEDEQITK